jgi:hypothetical protein
MSEIGKSFQSLTAVRLIGIAVMIKSREKQTGPQPVKEVTRLVVRLYEELSKEKGKVRRIS